MNESAHPLVDGPVVRTDDRAGQKIGQAAFPSGDTPGVSSWAGEAGELPAVSLLFCAALSWARRSVIRILLIK